MVERNASRGGMGGRGGITGRVGVGDMGVADGVAVACAVTCEVTVADPHAVAKAATSPTSASHFTGVDRETERITPLLHLDSIHCHSRCTS